VVTQSSLVLSTYANDQLQQDVARDKLVDEGKISQEEADDEAIEWETVRQIMFLVVVMDNIYFSHTILYYCENLL